MSSEVARSLSLSGSNVMSFISGTTINTVEVPYGNSVMRNYNSDYGGIILNSAAKSVLYPNNIAHPLRMTFKSHTKRSGGGLIVIGNPTTVFKVAGSTVVSQQGDHDGYDVNQTVNSAVITSSTINTDIQIGGYTPYQRCEIVSASITAYFTRYDFSAVAGEGVTSASVSSSTGYDGDPVTFSCVIPSGYVFDGWYNGSTLVSSLQSYPHTVSGSDLSLTAKAHQQTHNVNGTYNGSTKAILTGIVGDVAVGYNSKSASLNTASPSRTLSCANKLMRDNVSVGSAVLATSGKIMRSDLVLTYV